VPRRDYAGWLAGSAAAVTDAIEGW